MQWSDIKAMILKKVSAISGISWDERDFLRDSNTAQKIVTRFTGCLIRYRNTTSVSGQAEYTKANDCLRIKRITYAGKRLYNTSKSSLDVATIEGRISSPWTDVSDTPTHYYDEDIVKYGLYPKVNATGDTIAEEYVKSPVDLTEDNSIPFDGIAQLYDYHFLIPYYVVAECFLEASVKNSNLLPTAQFYQKEYNDGVMFLKQQMENKPDRLSTFGLIRRSSISGANPIPSVTI